MPITPEQFARLSLEQARSGLEKGDFTTAELTAASFARMDAEEPAMNAVITRAPAPSPGAPAGIPIAAKDCIMTKGLRSTCGSRHLDNFVPPYNATVVDKLAAAGFSVNAKTNMDEFAMGASGENSAYGATKNPWNPAHVPGGSSSGSAAIVAYGGALAALGSDTGGSIRQPASFCGLVGMKPTYGRVSRYGVAALASSLDQVGSLTRNVRDNALLMDILSGHDHLDSTSAKQADAALPCLPDVEKGVKGLRVAFDPSLFDRDGLSPVMAAAVKRAVDICRDGGAAITEAPLPLVDYGVAAYYIINCCEASTNMTKFDGVRYGVRSSGSDLWDVYCETRSHFGDEVKRRIMMGSYALSKGYYDAYYLKATRVRRLFASEADKLFTGVDALILPVAPQSPRKLGTKTTVLEDYLGDVFTLPANLTGVPSLAFPTGVEGGLPTGVQVMGARFREDILYRVGRTVEKETTLPNAPWETAK